MRALNHTKYGLYCNWIISMLIVVVVAAVLCAWRSVCLGKIISRSWKRVARSLGEELGDLPWQLDVCLTFDCYGTKTASGRRTSMKQSTTWQQFLQGSSFNSIWASGQVSVRRSKDMSRRTVVRVLCLGHRAVSLLYGNSRRPLHTSVSSASSQPNGGFKPEKVAVVTKTTRYEFEQQRYRYAGLSEEDLKQLVRLHFTFRHACWPQEQNKPVT